MANIEVGTEARAGGWGPLFSDEGSAYWIGVAALRGLGRGVDCRAGPSPLGEALMRRWPELGADLRSWAIAVSASEARPALFSA